MKTPFSGGCACGAIRYECDSEPSEMFQCHCRDCQRASGGTGSFVVVVPAKSFRLTQGSPRYHFTTSEMGFQHKRGFCPQCGSRITGGENAEGTSPIVGINAASLDDPSWFRPQYHIFVSEAQPWEYLSPAVPKFPKFRHEERSGDARPLPRKEAALSFLRLSAAGKVREAYQNYVAPNFRHHNPYFRGDAASLSKGMEENAAKHPDKLLEVQRALEDGDYVAVHSRVRLKPGDSGLALVHIFKFYGDRIVELWDLGQPVVENSPNEYGMF